MLSVKADEHLRIRHDSGAGFLIHVERGELHIRAKAPDEPQSDSTTLVIESRVELTK